MRKRILYVSLLVFPLLSMVLINEFARSNVLEKGFNYYNVTAINSAGKFKKKCSWACHNITNFCKENHVALAKPYFNIIDPLYFGIIKSLKSTGHYGLANLIVFVFLLPLIMYLLLVKVIGIQLQINKLKKEKV